MTLLNPDANLDKKEVLEYIKTFLDDTGIRISHTDDERPWGGFFVIDDASTDRFIKTYFSEANQADIYRYGTAIRPKILLVAPGQKLSWQYHNRRAELWKVVLGPVGVLESLTDQQPDDIRILETGGMVQHGNQARHRLIGLDQWGVVAEIWQHTDPNQPSDEDDIVRLEDSYGR